MAEYGYIRVSDDEQNEDLQVDALLASGCERLCGDHGVSGRTIERKGLNEVIEELKQGDTLWVWKIDRLGRDAIFLLLLARDFKARGIKLKSVTEPFDVLADDNKLNYGIRALFAEQESDSISLRTKAGMDAAKRRGKHVGRPRRLTQEQIENLRNIVPLTPYNEHQTIANTYHISLKTLYRYVNSPDERKAANARSYD